MLSRLALRPANKIAWIRPVAVQIRENQVQASSDDKPLLPIIIKDGPERDLKNFPRTKPPIEQAKTRMGFLPESWFTFFYPKTGVTGPYLFGLGFANYVLSKEIWVMEHEFYTGISILLMIIYAHTKFGPGVKESLQKKLDDEEAANDKFQTDHIKAMEEMIKDEEKAQWSAQGQKVLVDAKKENVQMQLEATYRQRLMQVYTEVKKRLDFQVEMQNAEKRFYHKNMVNWIVNSVVKSITPQQEKEALQKCIADLKSLAAKA